MFVCHKIVKIVTLINKNLNFHKKHLMIIMQHNIQKHNRCHKIDIHQIINKFVRFNDKVP